MKHESQEPTSTKKGTSNARTRRVKLIVLGVIVVLVLASNWLYRHYIWEASLKGSVIQGSAEFVVPGDWKEETNKLVGIWYFVPPSWFSGGVGGPRNTAPGYNRAVQQYETFSSSSFRGLDDSGITVEVRMSSPPNIDKPCKVKHIEDMQLKLIGSTAQVLFCESSSLGKKVSHTILADGSFEVGKEYNEIGVPLGDKTLGIEITFSDSNDQDSQKSLKLKEYTLNELQSNTDFQTAIDVVRTIEKL